MSPESPKEPDEAPFQGTGWFRWGKTSGTHVSLPGSHNSSQIHVMKHLVHIHMPHWHPFVCFGCQLQPTGRQKLKKKGQKVNTTMLQHAMRRLIVEPAGPNPMA